MLVEERWGAQGHTSNLVQIVVAEAAMMALEISPLQATKGLMSIVHWRGFG